MPIPKNPIFSFYKYFILTNKTETEVARPFCLSALLLKGKDGIYPLSNSQAVIIIIRTFLLIGKSISAFDVIKDTFIVAGWMWTQITGNHHACLLLFK